MKISELLHPSDVYCDVKCSSKKNIFDTIIDILCKSYLNFDKKQIYNSLLSRERLGSTGLGNGVAIPHGRLKGDYETRAIFLKLAHPVDYDAPDAELVNLLFAMVIPEHAANQHLDTLSNIAKTLNQRSLIRQINRLSDPKRIYNILTVET